MNSPVIIIYSCKFYLQSQTKELGHEVSSPLPPLSMLIIRWFSSFLMKETRYYPTLIRGDGRCGSSVPTTFGRDCCFTAIFFSVWTSKWNHHDDILPVRVNAVKHSLISFYVVLKVLCKLCKHRLQRNNDKRRQMEKYITLKSLTAGWVVSHLMT